MEIFPRQVAFPDIPPGDPKSRTPLIPVYIEPCNSVAANHWDEATNCAVTLATTDGLHMTGKGSIKIYPDASQTACYASSTFAAPIDISAAKWIRVWFYVDPAGVADLNEILLYLMTSSSDYRVFQLWDDNGAGASGKAGWNVAYINVSGDTYAADGGTYNPASVATVRVRPQFDSGKRPIVYIDEVAFMPGLAVPKVAITFDDGWYRAANGDAWEACQYLLSKGLTATIYAIAGNIGNTNYLTVDQLLELQSRGILVANHSYTHPDWTTLSYAQMKAEIVRAARWMGENGFGRGARYFAVPAGVFDWATWKNVYAPLGLQVRSTRTPGYKFRLQPPVPEGELWYWTSQNDWTLIDDTPAATSGSGWAVDQAIADGGVAIIGGHYWDASPNSQAEYEAFVDDLAASRDAGDVEVVTMADL